MNPDLQDQNLNLLLKGRESSRGANGTESRYCQNCAVRITPGGHPGHFGTAGGRTVCAGPRPVTFSASLGPASSSRPSSRPSCAFGLSSAPAGNAGLPLVAVSMVTRAGIAADFPTLVPGSRPEFDRRPRAQQRGSQTKGGGGGARSRRKVAARGEEPQAPPASRTRPLHFAF